MTSYALGTIDSLDCIAIFWLGLPVGNTIGDEHDGLVAIGANVRIVEAVSEQFEGHSQGRGEVCDLLRRDLLHGLLELANVLVRGLIRIGRFTIKKMILSSLKQPSLSTKY